MKILLVGDVMLGRIVNEALKREAPAFPWGDTLPLFRSADLRICNLECVISDRGRPWSATPKVFHFQSDAKNVAVLKAAGIDIVSLANNHVLDFEYDALLEMLSILERTGIRYSGAGRNIWDACEPAIAGVAGMRLGLLAFTDNEPEWEAGDDKPGTCYAPVDRKHPNARHLLDVVARTRPRVDALIVSAHWGPNWGYDPPPGHPDFGRALLDAGADVVFGHSAHIFRGIEIRGRKAILYSAGDFIDDYAVDEVERNDESFLFVLDLSAAGVRSISLYPSVIRGLRARMAPAGVAESIARKMQALCAKLGTKSTWVGADRCLRIEAEGGISSGLTPHHFPGGSRYG